MLHLVGTNFLFFFNPNNPADSNLIIFELSIPTFSNSNKATLDFTSLSLTKYSTFFFILGFSCNLTLSTSPTLEINGTLDSLSSCFITGFFNLNSVETDLSAMAISCIVFKNLFFKTALFTLSRLLP